MSTNLGGVESSMRVSLEGIEEAKKQFSDLRKDAKNLESIKGKVELDVQQVDVDGLMKQVKRAEREIKASALRSTLPRTPVINSSPPEMSNLPLRMPSKNLRA